jgi:hypothetical protein
MDLKNIIKEELLKEDDGVKIVWDETKKLFPYLNLEKRGNNGIAVIGRGERELITITGNINYIESNLVVFLQGMAAGYKERV